MLSKSNTIDTYLFLAFRPWWKVQSIRRLVCQHHLLDFRRPSVRIQVAGPIITQSTLTNTLKTVNSRSSSSRDVARRILDADWFPRRAHKISLTSALKCFFNRPSRFNVPEARPLAHRHIGTVTMRGWHEQTLPSQTSFVTSSTMVGIG